MALYKVYYLDRNGGTTYCTVNADDRESAKRAVRREHDDVLSATRIWRRWIFLKYALILVGVVALVVFASLLSRAT